MKSVRGASQMLVYSTWCETTHGKLNRQTNNWSTSICFCHLSFLCRYKVVTQRLHGKLHSIPQFVAEVTVTQNAVDIQVYIPS